MRFIITITATGAKQATTMTPSIRNQSIVTKETRIDPPQDDRQFGLFPYLSDDLKHTILSFIADAPLEDLPDNYIKSTLTHELPHVSKKFHKLTKRDDYWKTAIVRQASREPLLWRKALARTCSQHLKSESRSANFQRRQQADNTTETNLELIERTHKTLGKPTYKSIYKNVVSNHLRFKGPALIFLGRIQLGVPYELNLTEPRYQDVIRHVLRDHPLEASQGGAIDRDAVFVHVNRGPLEERTPAVLVQILRCQKQATSTHVVLLPFAHVWLEKACMKQPSEMVMVQCLKMGKGVASDMNRLARQEALAHVLDQLAVDVLTNDLLQDEYDDDTDSDDDDESVTSSSTSSSGYSELEDLAPFILGE